MDNERMGLILYVFELYFQIVVAELSGKGVLVNW